MSSTAGKHVQWNLHGTVYHTIRRSATTPGTLRVRGVEVPTAILRAGCGAPVGNQWRKPVEGSERRAIEGWGLRPCQRCWGADYQPLWVEHLGAV